MGANANGKEVGMKKACEMQGTPTCHRRQLQYHMMVFCREMGKALRPFIESVNRATRACDDVALEFIRGMRRP